MKSAPGPSSQAPNRWIVGGRKCSMAISGFWNLVGLHISSCRAIVPGWRSGWAAGNMNRRQARVRSILEVQARLVLEKNT